VRDPDLDDLLAWCSKEGGLMTVRVWRYEVATDVREEFEREYGPGGSWARLFAASPGFVATSLYVEVGSPASYLTVDRFADDQAWQQFRSEHDTAYQELGERLGHLTIAQEELV
jgi:hypothetical protein